MWRQIIASLKGLTVLTLMVFSTFGMFIPYFIVGIIKVIPIQSHRLRCTTILEKIGEIWGDLIRLIINVFRLTTWHITPDIEVTTAGKYFVISNHQSWTDIVAYVYTFNRRLPMFRFFLKEEIKWMPVFGFAAWALECPFMKRPTKQEIAHNPALRYADLEAARESVQFFKNRPVAIVNYPEGTLVSAEKQAKQNSPYQHLLRPKAGGLGLILTAMGDRLTHIVDVTITYPQPITFWRFVTGELSELFVDVELLPIGGEMTGRDYFTDDAFKQSLKQYINNRWAEKDATMTGRYAQLKALAAEGGER